MGKQESKSKYKGSRTCQACDAKDEVIDELMERIKVLEDQLICPKCGTTELLCGHRGKKGCSSGG